MHSDLFAIHEQMTTALTETTPTETTGVRGFFKSIFPTQNQEHDTDSLAKEAFELMLRSSYGADPKLLMASLKRIFDQRHQVYQMTVPELETFIQSLPHHFQSPYTLKDLLPRLAKRGWPQDERFGFLCPLIYIYMQKEYNFRLTSCEWLFQEMGRERIPEIIWLLLVNTARKKQLPLIFEFFREKDRWNEHLFRNLPADWRADIHDLFFGSRDFIEKVLLKESGVNLDASEKWSDAVKVHFENWETTLWHETTLPYNERAGDVTQFALFQELTAQDQAFKLEFYKLLCVRQHTLNHHLNWRIQSLRDKLFLQIEWTDFKALREMMKAHQVMRLHTNTKVLCEAVLKKMKTEPLPLDFYEQLRDFSYTVSPQEKKHFRAVMKAFLEKGDGLDEDYLQAERLKYSGFEPGHAPGMHNPYTGRHPDQARDYFKLLSQVVPVDVIKFYKRFSPIHNHDTYFVKFRLKDDLYEIDTHQLEKDLNQILFNQGVPWQLVAMTKPPGCEKVAYDVMKKEESVLLVNRESWMRFKDALGLKHAIEFYDLGGEVPLQTWLHLDEIDFVVKERADLDSYNPLEDARFAAFTGLFQEKKEGEKWYDLIGHLMCYPTKGKASPTWKKKTEQLVVAIGEAGFQHYVPLVTDQLLQNSEWIDDGDKRCATKGFAWACRFYPNQQTVFALQKMVLAGYHKIKWKGPRATDLGNEALESLAKIGSQEAFAAVSSMKAKSKYPRFVKALEKTLKSFIAKGDDNTSVADLEDRSVLDFGLNHGISETVIGDYTARLTMVELKPVLCFITPNGKEQKSVPAALKADFEGELAGLKSTVKNLEETITAQKKRLEKSWMDDRSWAIGDWKSIFLKHPLLSLLAERLVWSATDEIDNRLSFMPGKGQFLNEKGREVALPENGTIRLWHPVEASVEEVMHWRDFIFEHRIKQPVKQVFREIYVLTDAEISTANHSNRFAGHILKGNLLYGIGLQRGWKMQSDTYPFLEIPAFGLTAHLTFGDCRWSSPALTGKLFFKKPDPSLKRYQQHQQPDLQLDTIPPVVFSEVFRDVDLFVAVTSIGIDPNWRDNRNMDYWRDYAYGEKSKTTSAKARKELLERLLPLTKIRQQCTFEDNFLVVKGKRTTYKINLGSANILMEPNQQYLCIVPGVQAIGKADGKVWLPFDGDATLSLILSKAFLLAEDDKITDPTILSQIGRRG